MARNPYSFPARSREAMIQAMESIGGYYGGRDGRSAFSWNVKLPYFSRANEAATLNPFHYEGGRFAPCLDDAWQAEMESDGFDYNLIEDMRRELDDWSMFPGVDSDQFAFSFAGRQGGHLILESAYGHDMSRLDFGDMRDEQTQWGIERSEWSFADIRRLYRAVTVMDSDFDSEHVKSAMLHAIAFARMQWEEAQAEHLGELIEEAARRKAIACDILAAMRSSELPSVIVRESRLRVAKLARDARTARIEAARLMFADDATELFGEAA